MSDKTADMLAAKERFSNGFEMPSRVSGAFIRGYEDGYKFAAVSQAQQIEDLTREVARLRKLNEPIWDERNSE